MKPKTVLVQVNSFALGGTQIAAIDLANALREHGFHSIIAGYEDTIPNGPSLFHVAGARGLPIEIMKRRASTWTHAKALDEVAEKYDADLVHIYGAWDDRPAYWGPCLLGKRPLVTTIYDMKINAEMARCGTELIVGTGFLHDDHCSRTGGIHLVSPPVDLRRDDPEALTETWSKEAGVLNIALVTRLDEDMKAQTVELCIAAMDVLAERGFRLNIVGTGNAASRLNASAEAVNARHGRQLVNMLGPMADPRPVYANADIVVGMGTSAARGLAFGKPLVVSGQFGWFKVFEPASAAALFRNSFWSDRSAISPLNDLIVALEQLSASPETRTRLGQFGRNFAEEHFGLDAMSEKLAKIYNEALLRYGPRRWLADLPMELAIVARRLTGRPGYLPFDLHAPARGNVST